MAHYKFDILNSEVYTIYYMLLLHSKVLRLDITPMAPSLSHSVDPARLVCLSPRALDQLVVITSGARLLKFSASTGQLLSEVMTSSCNTVLIQSHLVPYPSSQPTKCDDITAHFKTVTSGMEALIQELV